MSTTDTPTRLSDELTARVVAKQHEKAIKPRSYGSIRGRGGYFVDTDDEPYADPRDDPNAALELLHYVVDADGLMITNDRQGWRLLDVDLLVVYRTIPISGPAFCYAVVRLAAEVFGVTEGGE